MNPLLNRAIQREIEWDCAHIVLAFYAALDAKRYGDLAALFTPDGVWNRLGKDLVGPAAILAAMESRTDWLTAHVVTNLRVTARDADTAETEQYVTLYRHEGIDPDLKTPPPVVLPLAILRHRDALLRVGETWKFSRKSSRAVMADPARVTHYRPGEPKPG